MDVLFVFTCGIAWRKYRDSEARLELIKALESGDPDAALVAEVMLDETGDLRPKRCRPSTPSSASDVKVSISDVVEFLFASSHTLPDAA